MKNAIITISFLLLVVLITFIIQKSAPERVYYEYLDRIEHNMSISICEEYTGGFLSSTCKQATIITNKDELIHFINTKYKVDILQMLGSKSDAGNHR